MFAGWKIVAVAFLVATFAWGIGFYGLGVYLVVLHDRLGWPVSLISIAITGYYVLSAAMITLVGDAFDRFGPRKVLTVAIGALAVGVSVIGSAGRPWQLCLGLAVMAVGWAGMSGAAINAIVAPWFEKKRGLAVSMAMNGATCGGVLLVPLWAALIPALGFPVAALVVAGVMIAILAGRGVHAPRTGRARAPSRRRDPAGRDRLARLRGARSGRGARAARRSRLLLAPLLDRLGRVRPRPARAGRVPDPPGGLSEPAHRREGAALAVSLTTLAAIVGRLVTGVFIDRVDRRVASSCNFAVQALAVFAMIQWPSVPVSISVARSSASGSAT